MACERVALHGRYGFIIVLYICYILDGEWNRVNGIGANVWSACDSCIFM